MQDVKPYSGDLEEYEDDVWEITEAFFGKSVGVEIRNGSHYYRDSCYQNDDLGILIARNLTSNKGRNSFDKLMETIKEQVGHLEPSFVLFFLFSCQRGKEDFIRLYGPDDKCNNDKHQPKTKVQRDACNVRRLQSDIIEKVQNMESCKGIPKVFMVNCFAEEQKQNEPDIQLEIEGEAHSDTLILYSAQKRAKNKPERQKNQVISVLTAEVRRLNKMGSSPPEIATIISQPNEFRVHVEDVYRGWLEDICIQICKVVPGDDHEVKPTITSKHPEGAEGEGNDDKLYTEVVHQPEYLTNFRCKLSVLDILETVKEAIKSRSIKPA